MCTRALPCNPISNPLTALDSRHGKTIQHVCGFCAAATLAQWANMVFRRLSRSSVAMPADRLAGAPAAPMRDICWKPHLSYSLQRAASSRGSTFAFGRHDAHVLAAFSHLHDLCAPAAGCRASHARSCGQKVHVLIADPYATSRCFAVSVKAQTQIGCSRVPV